ncbi:MAG: U32 family peptidase, partial [Candidatus Diapherotrites archaeon]|nr:U32 family peptidase [Candidatus Diapherotrites archaeon]
PNGRILELECFVHGALCIAVSGSCYKSLFTENHSANRGECLQNCRREYTVTDDSNKQLKVVNNYIMSPADLCTVDFVDKLVEAGIDVFKIEGRAKGADYVFEVTRAYREALNAIEKNSYTFELRKELRGRLEKVYNRGFGDGYFLGQTLDDWSKQYGSKATEKKFFVGNVKHFYSDISVAEILLEAGELNIGDEISVIGDTTGFFRQKILEMQFEKNPVQKAEKGSRIAIKVSEKVRVGDKVYVIQKASGEQEFTKTAWV